MPCLLLSRRLRVGTWKQRTRQNSRAYWQNGRTAEGVLPDTYEPAEPLVHKAQLLLKVDLGSLGQGASTDIEKIEKGIWQAIENKYGRTS